MVMSQGPKALVYSAILVCFAVASAGCDSPSKRGNTVDQGANPVDAAPRNNDASHRGHDAAPRGIPRPDMAVLERGHTVFAFPIHPDDRQHIHAGLVIGVDHDPASNSRIVCQNYEGRGFPGCYDEHQGTDFMVWGSFETTDERDIRVIAAAAGIVTRIEDGHYDRCSGDLNTLEVDCHGHEMVANRVHIRHSDGVQSRYLHLKKDSLAVEVGTAVECGQLLAFVGSSGRSIGPHLHFEVHDENGALMDPYTATDNQMNSYWSKQSTADGLPAPICFP
jgi:murein DD-endopeptidase MepM/ murein hydrolase activator NlpD